MDKHPHLDGSGMLVLYATLSPIHNDYCNGAESINMNMLEDLNQIGFRHVTQWILKGDKIGPKSFDWEDHGGWLYAFVVSSEVKYIGLTDRVLRSRLSDYSHNKTSQPERIRNAIIREIMTGHAIDILGWRESDKDVLVAEEARLRATYRPPWNRI